jgi:hypothetical protein
MKGFTKRELANSVYIYIYIYIYIIVLFENKVKIEGYLIK